MIIVPCSLNLMNTSQILCKFGLVWTHSETIVCWKNQGAERDRYFFEHVKVLWVKCLPPSFPVSLQHIPQGDISWINYLHRIHWDKRVTRRDSSLGKGPSFFLFPYGDCGTHHLSFLQKKGGQRTNTESPTSSLFCSSYLGRMEIAGLCLHISSRNCFQLLVISLPLDSIEGCVCPTQAEKQEGLISENLITTALSKYLKILPAPLHTPHQILMLKKKLQIFLWEKSLQLPV